MKTKMRFMQRNQLAPNKRSPKGIGGWKKLQRALKPKMIVNEILLLLK